jgi:hypothetical protein
MQDDRRDDNLKTIWQNQPMEPSQMTLEELQKKARELRTKTRRELCANIAIALLVFAISGLGILHTHSLGVRLVFGLAIAWALAGQYFLHRGMWFATRPAGAALSSGLEFYRRQLEQRLSIFHRVLQWSFGPVVLSITTLILVLAGIARNQNQSAEKVIPFCTAFVLWIVVLFVLRSRSHRQLRQEIHELNKLDKASTH